MPEPSERLALRVHALAWRLHSDTAQPHDFERLEALLADNPQALVEYVRFMSLLSDVALASNPALLPPGPVAAPQEPAAAQEPPAPSTAQPAESTPVLGFLGSALHGAAGWLTSPKFLALAVLGSLATYFAGLMVSIAISRALLTDRSAQQRVETASPARILAEQDCRWSEGAPRTDRGGNLTAGTSRLSEGVVQLEFDSGARVQIAGPAQFTLRSGQRLELAQGWLMAYVPRQARGFTIGTPTAEVIDLGTEFGVAVAGDGQTEVHVLRGVVEVKRPPAADDASQPAAEQGGSIRVSAGSAVQVSRGVQAASIDFDGQQFSTTSKLAAAAQSRSREPGSRKTARRVIWLGNLFDDPPGTPLDDAMHSDTFGAGAEAEDLGVERVVYGGDPIVQISPGVTFDFRNVGWGKGEFRLQAANDAWSVGFGGIRLKGEPLAERAPKLEEGIGLCSSALLTFDLEEIRWAGNLGSQAFDFVCDSAGVNDSGMNPSPELKMKGGGSIHLLVLISDGSNLLSANVDGTAMPLASKNAVWSIARPAGPALKTFGPYISVRQPIPAEAKYLTLATSGAGDNHWDDHGVWVGARLEAADPAGGQPPSGH